MHELSMALEVCRIAEEQVGRSSLADVVEVGVEVGAGSGIEPDNFVFCLDALLSGPPFGRGRTRLLEAEGDTLRVQYLEIDDDHQTH